MRILSLAGCDQPRATSAILLDLARRYLELRAPAALAYGRVHFDPALQKNPHVHLAISGNLCGQAKKLRLPKAEFRAVQEELERYQRERYPFLTHSLVFAAPPDPALRRPPHPQSERRSQKKRQLRERYLAARLQAASERDFRFRLQEEGMGLYFRGGRLAGVTADGRKYRLQTLGIPDTFAADCAGWQRLPGRLGALEDVALAQTRTRVRAHGFAEALLAVVSGGDRSGLAAILKERLAALDALRRRAFPAAREGPAPG